MKEKFDLKDYKNNINEMKVGEKRLINSLHLTAAAVTALRIDIQRGVLKPVGIIKHVNMSDYQNGFKLLPLAEYIKLN